MVTVCTQYPELALTSVLVEFHISVPIRAFECAQFHITLPDRTNECAHFHKSKKGITKEKAKICKKTKTCGHYLSRIITGRG